MESDRHEPQRGPHQQGTEDDQVEARNLRLVAVTLKESFQRVVDPTLSLRAELIFDDERFELVIDEGDVAVRHRAATNPQVVMSMDYEATIGVADGQLSPDEFAAKHVEVSSEEPEAVQALMQLLATAMANMAG